MLKSASTALKNMPSPWEKSGLTRTEFLIQLTDSANLLTKSIKTKTPILSRQETLIQVSRAVEYIGWELLQREAHNLFVLHNQAQLLNSFNAKP